MDKGNSLDDLMAFLDYGIKKGLIQRNTGFAQKAACTQVLGILESSEKSNLSELDIDTVFKRYINLNPNKLTPASLKSYRSRVEKAITGFFSYRKDPSNWRPSFQKRTSARRTNGDEIPKQKDKHFLHQNVTKTLSFPFPMREDLTITISNIPRDLKISEARRLSAFLETLAVDFKPSSQ